MKTDYFFMKKFQQIICNFFRHPDTYTGFPPCRRNFICLDIYAFKRKSSGVSEFQIICLRLFSSQRTNLFFQIITKQSITNLLNFFITLGLINKLIFFFSTNISAYSL